MEAIAQKPFRIKARIGVNEFDAEGQGEEEVALIKEQYDLFVRTINSVPQSPAAKTAISTVVNETDEGEDDDIIEGEVVESKTWSRIYKLDGEQVSLLVFPQTQTVNADSIILLIYGYQTLLKRDAVASTELMDAAKWSGLRIDRIDRNLTNGHAAFVVKGGSRKGSRYSLNNRGAAYAQELLERMFD